MDLVITENQHEWEKHLDERGLDWRAVDCLRTYCGYAAQVGLAARPQTRSIASAPDGAEESRPDQIAIGRADDGRTP